MALEILSSVDIHDLCMESNSALTVPLPPPLPKLPHSTAKLGAGDANSLDSGHGNEFMLFGQDAFPGLYLSDSEFSEEFSDISAASSRRGSIPNAPPPPQIPSYLRDSATARRLALTSTFPSRQSYYSEELGSGRSYDDSDEDLVKHICIVCYDEQVFFNGGRKCCNAHVCQVCMVTIAQTSIKEGKVFIQCPNPECKKGALGREEILSLVDSKTRETFIRLRLEAEGDVTQKACPNCSLITKHTLPKRYRKYREENVRITCTQCQHVWCFSCHAPWHKDLTCKQHKKGSIKFEQWSKARSAGIANCQKCPLCQVYIQRTSGCDHMTCNRCDSHFCYKCGGSFLEFPGLGDHYRKTSILGCKRNYKADKPAKRLAIRGSYFGAKMAALTGYPVLFLAGAVVVVAVGAVALPVYGGYRYYKYRKNLKRRYGRRRRH